MCKVKSLLIQFIVCTLLLGCSSLVTGYRNLEDDKEHQAVEKFGNGKYYRFVANGSDLRNTGEIGINAIKHLINQNKNKPQECMLDYNIINQTYVFFEGGAASIFVRC
jgi:hypothetical protein